MRSAHALRLVLLLGAPALLGGCSPDAITDGRFGCPDDRCPTSHPFCHSDQRCYATMETDRPDTGPRPDSGRLGGQYELCSGVGDCMSPYECVARSGGNGYCIQRCASMGPCTGGGVCAPQVLGPSPDFVCLGDCNMSGCPAGAEPRRDALMPAVCHCIPSGSNWR